jgi:enamine deaminase RidA (YjgF/YER057c/UK114 family)
MEVALFQVARPAAISRMRTNTVAGRAVHAPGNVYGSTAGKKPTRDEHLLRLVWPLVGASRLPAPDDGAADSGLEPRHPQRRGPAMSKITRQGSNPILSTSVEYHNFVYLAGITADDLSKDITGQTEEVIAKINAALENNGTDKTRLLTAQIWLKHITDRDTMNKVWVKWLGDDGRPARACVQAEMADPRHLVEIMITACR